MAVRFNFTVAALERLPTPTKRTYYRDIKNPALGLYVTETGVKVFCYVGTIGGKTRRIPLGKFPALNVTQARDRATKMSGDVAHGIDPIARKRAAKPATVTLSSVLEAYIAAKNIKGSTEANYRRELERTFGVYLNRPLGDITEAAVMRIYLERAAASPGRAELGAKVISALFTFSAAVYRTPDGKPAFPSNPASVLSRAKVRHRIPRRQRLVGDMSVWWGAVHALEPVPRDFLVFLALTGVRRAEALGLTWENVSERSFDLTETKGGRPAILPMPAYAWSLLQDREVRGPVFPLNKTEVERAVRHVSKVAGAFSCHDLRRGFATAASDLDISVYAVKALLNHAPSQDVTAGYVIPSLDRLRAASAKVERHLLAKATGKAGKVIAIR